MPQGSWVAEAPNQCRFGASQATFDKAHSIASASGTRARPRGSKKEAPQAIQTTTYESSFPHIASISVGSSSSVRELLTRLVMWALVGFQIEHLFFRALG
jgi:hypothetical protein